MVTVRTIDELLGKPLAEARHELAANFRSPEDLRKRWEQALGLPKVAQFREALEDYIMRAEELADRLVGDNGVVLNAFERANTETRHAWQVFGICYGHPVPKTVAIASLSTAETDKFPTVEDALSNRRFSYADLTHSYHTETIDKEGRVLCKDHSTPVVWEVGAKVHRLVPRPKIKPAAIEDAIIEDLAHTFYGSNGANGRGKRIRDEVRKNLEVLLRVGEGGIYRSIYEALEQTSHRAITATHIAKHADLDKLTQTFKELIGYDAKTETLPPQQLAHQFKETELFKAIGQLAAKYIPAPLVVTNLRTKGQTLVDKVTVREHYGQLLEADSKRKLPRHYERLGFKKLGIQTPDRMKAEPPNIDDVVGVEAKTHSGDDYDMSELASGGYVATVKQIAEGRADANMILGVIAEIPENLRGYIREELVRTNGKKQRMPPDKDKPRFRVLGVQTTRTSLTVDLVPSPQGKFDDYFVAPKPSGYMALHTVIGTVDPDLEGAVVEFKVKPNFVDNLEWLAQEESHENYKIVRAAQIRYLRQNGQVSDMEWEMNKLLLTPPGRVYIEPQLLAINGNGKNHASGKLLAAAK